MESTTAVRTCSRDQHSFLRLVNLFMIGIHRESLNDPLVTI
jgi:hypothetical protein